MHKMTHFVFFTLFGLAVVFQCKGQVKNGDTVILVPGKTAKIQWQFNIKDITHVLNRYWHFTSSDGTLGNELLARIDKDKPAVIETSRLTGIKIEKPATLVLENTNQSYDGSYTFTIGAGIHGDLSTVTVIIAVTPKVTVNCSRLTTVNKGEDIQCVCEGKGGKPPANVTWYDKAGKKIGETGNEMQTLRLPNVNQKDSGQYTCVAKNHKDSENATSFVLTVNYPPENVRVVLPSEIAVRGKSFTIKCGADGNPLPIFKIFFNETELPISGDTYTIPKVNDGHVGFYKCVANNSLGTSDSEPLYLDVGNAEIHRDDDGGLGTGAIVGIVIGVLVFVLIIVLLYLFVFKKKNNDHERVRSESNRATEQPPEQLTYAALDQKALKKGAAGKPASTSTPTEYAAIQVS